LKFDTALDRELVRDPASFAAEEWNYRWTRNYGSPDVSRRHPTREGRDQRQIASVTAIDARTILLRFREPLEPVHVLRVSYSLESSAGDELRGEFYCTIAPR
jgi:hypothetical protein